MPRAGLALCLLLLLASTGVGATPFVPEHDAVVLEELPASAEGRELRALRARLAREPQNLALALELAAQYLARGRAEADPRYLGWAEGVLAPFTREVDPPPRVRLLRAALRQSRHEFAAALDDLAHVVEREPRSAEAWWSASSILLAQGDPAAAERACRPLLGRADPLVAASCVAAAAGASGRGARSLALLEGALAAAPDAPPELHRFALTLLAEQALRLGRDAVAERAFRAALALGPHDAYLLAARADQLLARGRAAEVVELLEGMQRVDGLLLRLALAEQQLGAPALGEHVAVLRARMLASRARGESLHLGEEARFALAFDADPAAALALAARNFELQKEPRDAQVLLEAALAAGDVGAARPAGAWLAATGLEDATLSALAARTRELR